MHHKYEILDAFLNWKKMIETHIGRKIKWLRLDTIASLSASIYEGM